MQRISVLMTKNEDKRFSAYCVERGFKKSTLIARLIREHLDAEGYTAQPRLEPATVPQDLATSSHP